MPRRRDVSIAAVLVLMLLGFFTLLEPPPVSASGSGCIDVQPSPVLQDSGWGTFNGTATFSTQYLGGSVIKWGQTF
ncbi:MAG TPA: hypothetical protein VEC02_01615, partial [Nitrososphaerales archaeon]|nr:hypothetical protein [Nitrososphaerales archaeon]